MNDRQRENQPQDLAYIDQCYSTCTRYIKPCTWIVKQYSSWLHSSTLQGVYLCIPWSGWREIQRNYDSGTQLCKGFRWSRRSGPLHRCNNTIQMIPVVRLAIDQLPGAWCVVYQYLPQYFIFYGSPAFGSNERFQSKEAIMEHGSEMVPGRCWTQQKQHQKRWSQSFVYLGRKEWRLIVGSVVTCFTFSFGEEHNGAPPLDKYEYLQLIFTKYWRYSPEFPNELVWVMCS